MADRPMTEEKTMTEIDIAALTALEKAATPAPWAHEHDGGHIVHGPESTVAEAEYAPDAKLIAAMRNQLPALLAELAEAGRKLHETLLRTPTAGQVELQGIWDAREAGAVPATPQADEPMPPNMSRLTPAEMDGMAAIGRARNREVFVPWECCGDHGPMCAVGDCAHDACCEDCPEWKREVAR